jgi:hypothetical protein
MRRRDISAYGEGVFGDVDVVLCASDAKPMMPAGFIASTIPLGARE